MISALKLPPVVVHAEEHAMSMPPRLRIMTYNVHRCVGRDGILAPERIVRAIAHYRPDIVALQELDVNRPRTRSANQASMIAEALGMEWVFFPAIELKDEHFGNAILTRLPMKLMHAGQLPVLAGHAHRERRAALWVTIEWHGQQVQFVTTHLGLKGMERVVQVNALMGAEWLAHSQCQPPLILAGDLNALPGTRAYRRLRTVLRDPFPWGGWPPGTFSSRFPILRLDHVLFSSGWTVHRVEVGRNRLTRIASDHLPLVVDASLN
jgi:endonuclease/exonuclease/phosphatase family metal-dependent hydrolase